MDFSEIDNINVASVEVLDPPERLRAEVAMTEAAFATVKAGRRQIEAILDGRDRRHGICTVAGLDGRGVFRSVLLRSTDSYLRHR